MKAMTTNLTITPSTTTSLDDGKHPYPVVPERLVQIDGVDYVRCGLHGLIPLTHNCADSPHDHWCRSAAHPSHDPADGDQGGTNHDEIHRLSWKVHNLADALLRACMYLEGFVWVSEPEFSELEGIKETVVEGLGVQTWEQAMDLARLREARRKASEG